VIGIIRKLTPPTLPQSIRQLTLVARLVDIQPVDEVAIVVGMVTASGLHAARTGSEQVMIEVAGEYILAVLNDVPLVEEGAHRFQIKLRGQPVVSVDVPVLTHSEHSAVALH
jgi:hypothetical protein